MQRLTCATVVRSRTENFVGELDGLRSTAAFSRGAARPQFAANLNI
jgi:hypothetical protein